jgi:hypothetical protein
MPLEVYTREHSIPISVTGCAHKCAGISRLKPERTSATHWVMLCRLSWRAASANARGLSEIISISAEINSEFVWAQARPTPVADVAPSPTPVRLRRIEVRVSQPRKNVGERRQAREI